MSINQAAPSFSNSKIRPLSSLIVTLFGHLNTANNLVMKTNWTRGAGYFKLLEVINKHPYSFSLWYRNRVIDRETLALKVYLPEKITKSPTEILSWLNQSRRNRFPGDALFSFTGNIQVWKVAILKAIQNNHFRNNCSLKIISNYFFTLVFCHSLTSFN